MKKLEDLEKGKRYSHEEIKHLLVEINPNRPKRARSNTFSEVDENSRKVFLEIEKQIKEKFPDAVVYAGGSRVNGDWIDESDYDINIYLHKSQWEEAKKIKFTYNVDVHFKHPEGILIRQIV